MSFSFALASLLQLLSSLSDHCHKSDMYISTTSFVKQFSCHRALLMNLTFIGNRSAKAALINSSIQPNRIKSFSVEKNLFVFCSVKPGQT